VFLSGAALGQAPALSIPYTVEKEGQVSLGVYDGKGTLVRTLLSAKKQDAGRYAAAWDGLDRNGPSAAPPTSGVGGTYTNPVGDQPIHMGDPFAFRHDGKGLFIVYHTHADPRKPSSDRVVNIDRLVFDADGKLRVLGPTRTPQPMP
jgi:hypothetical protein